MAEIIIPSSSSSIIPSVDPHQVTEVELPFRIIKLLDESHPIIHKEPVHWQFGVNPDPKRMHDVMLENMVYHRGLGLSANQIGMPVKVFAMRVDDSDNAIVCFNPKITKESDETVMMKEGCLSYPQLYLNVARPQAIEGTYQNADGDEINVHFEGLAARIFHHEMDHMEGNTFLNRVSRVFLQSARRKQKKLLRKGRQNGRTS